VQFARDMSVLLAGEVEKHTPPFETHFDKNPFEIITVSTGCALSMGLS
jgi:hypothetical protein